MMAASPAAARLFDATFKKILVERLDKTIPDWRREIGATEPDQEEQRQADVALVDELTQRLAAKKAALSAVARIFGDVFTPPQTAGRRLVSPGVRGVW